MARIRSVHPSLFTDEAWVSCSPLARLLYIGLWTDADDQGLFEWKPLQIRMRLLPGDTADVPALLAELVQVNLIAPLESGGKKLGAIRYFRKFQRPKKPNATFVLPREWVNYVGLGDGDQEPDSDDASPVPHQFPPEGEKPPQMEDGGWRMEQPPNPPMGDVRSDRFAEGWSAYPIAGRGNHGPARSEAEWPGAVDRAGGEDALIGAIKAHAAQLATDGGRAKSFDRWLRDDGFAAYLGLPGAKPISAWSGPQDVWQVVSRAMGEDQARGYLAHCRWQEGPVKAIIAPHEFAASKLRSGAGPAVGGLGIQIITEGEKAA